MLGLLKGLGISQYIMAAMGVAILLMGLGFYLYFKSSQATIASLNLDLGTSIANVATLKGSTAEQNKTILRIEAQRAKDQEKILELSAQKQKFTREVDDLRAKFRKHDMENLSLNKPGLIEKIINKGTAAVLDDLENITKPEEQPNE